MKTPIQAHEEQLAKLEALKEKLYINLGEITSKIHNHKVSIEILKIDPYSKENNTDITYIRSLHKQYKEDRLNHLDIEVMDHLKEVFEDMNMEDE